MNKQLEDLMYHAGLTASGCWDRMDDYDRKAIEKLALLIVNECADIAQQHNKSPVAAPLAIGHVIREHFEVEE